MILQTYLWQFVRFTFTDLGPALANWARNSYWSSSREIPNCDSPHMKESPHCPYEKTHPLALKNEPPIFMGGEICHVTNLMITATQQSIIIEIDEVIIQYYWDWDWCFEGSFLTALVKWSLDIRLKNFFYHNALLSTYSFLPF